MAREKFNNADPYLVNRGNSEFPNWQPARWESAHNLAGFHLMCMEDGAKVTVHDSAIRNVKADTKSLELEIERLLAHPELTADAKKLIQAALESQRTGKLEWSV